MVDLSPFAIITDADVRSGITSSSSRIQVESDCACPIEMPSYDSTDRNIDITTHRMTVPDLFMEPLDTNYTLAYNPCNPQGVALLNASSVSLLTHLRTTESSNTFPLQHSVAATKAVQYLANIGLIEVEGAKASNVFERNRTLTAWVHITNDCNLLCSYCYVNKSPDSLSLQRGRQAVDAVFRSAHAHDYSAVKLKYAGGEATLNISVLLELHRYASEKAVDEGLHLDGIILSNGVGITSKMIRSMLEHKLRLMISLDGIGAAHDAQRPFVNGRGSFSQVERTLDRLQTHGLVPSISITISQRNAHGLAETVAYLLERKLPFTFNFYRENDCSASVSDLRMQDEFLIDALGCAFKEIEKNLPPYSLLDRLTDLARLDGAHDRTCGVGHSYMVIDHQGNVSKCHMEMANVTSTVDLEDPLLDIIEDRKGIQNIAVMEKEGCRECTWRFVCTGGCPALTYRVTGRYDIKSPNCAIYKAIFPEVLRLEGLRILKYHGQHALYAVA